MKTCAKCRVEKPREAFSPDKRAKDGKCSHCRECHNVYNTTPQKREKDRLYRAGNKKKIAVMQKAYRVGNAERLRESKKAYQERNKAKLAEYKSGWAKKNSASIQERQRVWRDANPGKHRVYVESWRRNNQEAARAIVRNRRARKKSASGTHTAVDVQRLYELQEGLCFYCSKALETVYDVDHIIPLSAAGSNDITNLQLLCQPCNRRKSALDEATFLGRRLREIGASCYLL